MRPLPIDPLLPAAIGVLQGHARLVLRAAPGAGKTTRLPAALLDAGLAGGKTVLVLEPRRLAARAAAEYVAAERGGRLGDEVGYRVRFEHMGGPRTRLWFVTEGVVGRRLAEDPFLEDVGIAVLDEFHERHLQGDVVLAVVRELQETVRPDLKLVVMSATLETERVAAYLGECPVLTSAGRAYPVEVRHVDTPEERLSTARLVAAVGGVLAEEPRGDVLVFLPGAAEIRRVAAALEAMASAAGVAVVPLHGDLPLDAQRRAIEPGGRRKVVLSTNVAETSLTIEGVTAVVDSGLAREARFDPRHGINVLRTVRISQAAADQRAGRAGRLGPGRCVRLWSHAAHLHRRPHETPEIARLDLAPTLLELRAWGLRDPARFGWMEPPPAGPLQRADNLLRRLGAIAEDGGVTPTGRAMLRLGVHPRVARMLVEAEQRHVSAAGVLLAALTAERDICSEGRAFGPSSGARWPAGPSDLLVRMQLFAQAQRRGFARDACARLGLDHRTVLAVERVRRHLAARLGIRGDAADVADEAVLPCVVAGFPDRVVRRRAPGSPRGVMVGGLGCVLAEHSVVRAPELYIAVDVDRGAGSAHAEAVVRLASAVRHEWLEGLFPDALRADTTVEFDEERKAVVGHRREWFDDLVLRDAIDPRPDPNAIAAVLVDAARHDPVAALDPGPDARQLLARMRFLARACPEFGVPGDPQAVLRAALATLVVGRRSFAELRRADLVAVLRAQLTATQRAAVDREAPTHYELPSGRRVRILYEPDAPPAVEARIQEVFGLRQTPRLAAGRVPLVFRLLAPNNRPAQITDDLAGFWHGTYADVRKHLRGRYPKHAWPEDPLTTPPTRAPKRGPSVR